eukprot:CCRYP_015510-RA/>CCRYP_015510-RA protein AED:0.27 eAED:0.27 QI:331/1/1/1/0.5/0.33/3/566/388
MKATLLLLLLTSVAGNLIDEVEDVSNRRHSLFQKAHGRRVQDEDEAASATSTTTTTTTTTTATSLSAAGSGEGVDGAMSIQLTRTPTKGTSTTKRTVSKKPTSTTATGTSKKQSVGVTDNATATTPAESKGDESKRESADDMRASVAGTDSPTYMPSYVPTYMPTVQQSGKSRKVDPDYYDDDSIIIRTKSGKTGSGGGKSGKGSSPNSNVCKKRLDLAWEANVNADFVIAQTKNELKERCAFDTTNTNQSPFAPNLSCPFIYTPDTGFLDNEAAVVAFFGNLTGDDVTGTAFWLFQLYCECDAGIDNECLTKVPSLSSSSSAGKVDYCTFAGIWNGDFALGNYFDLDKEVQTCGCYFVSVEQEGIDNCPGVDLGAFFVDPTNSITRR